MLCESLASVSDNRVSDSLILKPGMNQIIYNAHRITFRNNKFSSWDNMLTQKTKA